MAKNKVQFVESLPTATRAEKEDGLDWYREILQENPHTWAEYPDPFESSSAAHARRNRIEQSEGAWAGFTASVRTGVLYVKWGN